jgi:AcrR family transcriptional regulator
VSKDTTTNDLWQGAREEQHRIRLGTIVDMASELFNRQGYYATSLSDVADQLKITKAALYYYVKNKEDLIYRCALRAVEQLKTALAAAEAEGRNGLQKIEILFREILEQRRGPIVVMSELASLMPNHKGEIARHQKELEDTIQRLVREGVADGTIADRDPKALTHWILGAINWAPKWYPGDGKVSAERLSPLFIEVIVNGLRSRKR